MKDSMRIFDAVAFSVVVGGALYLGIKGLVKIDLLAAILGDTSSLSRMVHVLIGAAAVYQLSQFRVVHDRWADASREKKRKK